MSFALAPRLNAAGRVGEALDAARLLLAEDAAEATVHADALEAANTSRRDLMKTAVGEARQRIIETGADPDAAVTMVRGPWPVGIVGLVASRLVEDHGRPAIVGAELGDVVRASCRSDGSLDLGAALTACADLFIRHGGHAGAAGFEIPAERWPEFVTGSGPSPRARRPGRPAPALRVDLAIPALDVDYALHRELAALAPHGPGNPDPLIAVLGLTVTRVRAAGTDHTQLTLKRRLDVLDGIAFGRADIAELVAVGDRIDVVARLTAAASAATSRCSSMSATRRPPAPTTRPAGHPHGGGRVTRRSAPGRRAPATRTASGRSGSLIAPVASIVGLVIVAIVTLNLLNGGCPSAAAGRERRRQRRWRSDPDAGAVGRGGRPRRGGLRRLDRVCQGRRHLRAGR